MSREAAIQEERHGLHVMLGCLHDGVVNSGRDTDGSAVRQAVHIVVLVFVAIVIVAVAVVSAIAAVVFGKYRESQGSKAGVVVGWDSRDDGGGGGGLKGVTGVAFDRKGDFGGGSGLDGQRGGGTSDCDSGKTYAGSGGGGFEVPRPTYSC